jgi:enterobacteria phage integrase
VILSAASALSARLPSISARASLRRERTYITGTASTQRRSDLSGGLIWVVQQKTGAELSIPLHPAVLAAIKATPAKGVTLIGDANGRPIQRATLTLIMRKAVELAGLPSRCVPHGLRKAIMRRLAESGSSAKEIAAISGHRSLKEIERYTAAADQVTLSKAAIAKLRDDKTRT